MLRILKVSFLAGLSLSQGNAQLFREPDWKKVRAQQPEGVTLELTLSKRKFYQGEVIEASLLFSNKSRVPYFVWDGKRDRAGRLGDIAFFAAGPDGKAVPDPLKWFFKRGWAGGGPGHYQKLGEWQVTLKANQWLRFDRPGSYTIFAFSSRVREGEGPFLGEGKESAAGPLVSDRVEIEILPLAAETEDRLIRERDWERLRYLQTPRARAELVFLLNQNQDFETVQSFYSAPDPVAVAPLILKAVGEGRLRLNSSLSYLYCTLKTADLSRSPGLPKEEAEKRQQEFLKAWKSASGEIEAAALRIPGEKG